MLSSRERYGLRALLDIAQNGTYEPVQTRAIAARQNIPEQYLNQLLLSLKRAGVVRSQRGASGGYRLSRPPQEVSLAEALMALGAPILRDSRPSGPVDAVWELEATLQNRTREILEGMSLQALLDRQLCIQYAQGLAANI